MRKLLVYIFLGLILCNTGFARSTGCVDGNCENGVGTWNYTDLTSYSGEWSGGNKHGKGTETWPNGYIYIGEFFDSKWRGKGKLTFPDGSKYEGEWVNGKMEGYGKRSNSDNKRWYKSYEGEFKNGKFHGQGKMLAKKILTDDMGRDRRLAKLKGLTFTGEFKNGRPWNVKSFNDSGEQQSIIFSNGKIAGHK